MIASEEWVRRFVSLGVAAAGGVLYYQMNPTAERAQVLAGGLLGLGGTTIGLLVAGLMLLVAGRGTRLVSNMALSGHLRVLARRIAVACIAWVACILTALSVLVSPDKASVLLTSIASALALWAMAETAGVTWRMMNVVRFWSPD